MVFVSNTDEKKERNQNEGEEKAQRIKTRRLVKMLVKTRKTPLKIPTLSGS
jgi:hypothetical protein